MHDNLYIRIPHDSESSKNVTAQKPSTKDKEQLQFGSDYITGQHGPNTRD